MIAPIVKDPIVTKEDAEKFNNLFKEKVAKHLFIFCNYSPIIENLQGQSARYIPNILNLYIFAVDSCFFLRRLPSIVKDDEFNAIKGPANEIKKYVDEISMLRSVVAHNNDDRNAFYVSRNGNVISEGKIYSYNDEYEFWVSSVIKKFPPSSLGDYDKLCQKLIDIKNQLFKLINEFINLVEKLSESTKQKFIKKWEDIIISVYAEDHKNYYNSQLVSMYCSLHSDEKNIRYYKIEQWIEIQVFSKVDAKIIRLQSDCREYDQALIDFSDDKENYPEAFEELVAQKSNAENDLKIAKDEKEKLEQEVDKMGGAKKYFFCHLKEQLNETLREGNFEDLLPQNFIQADIFNHFTSVPTD